MAAIFACSTGNYQITGIAYNLVPAGIFGRVVITVPAENATPATASLSIAKANANIAPAFIPGRIQVILLFTLTPQIELTSKLLVSTTISANNFHTI